MTLAKIINFAFGCGVALIGLTTANTSQAATFIDTTPGEFTAIGLLGEFSGGVGSFGQTFIAPTTDNILNDFSFFYVDLQDDDIDIVDFRAFVAAFDSTTNTIIGDILFESASQSTTQNLFFEQPFTFNTGGLALISGQEYVAFLSPVKDLDGVIGFGYLTYADESVAPYEDGGGRAVVSIASTFSTLVTQPFFTTGPNRDLGFKATFTSQTTPVPESVPEPASILGTLAFAALGGKKLLKRKQEKTV